MIVGLLTYKLAALYVLSRDVDRYLPRFTINKNLVQVEGEVCRAVKCGVLVLKRLIAT